MFTIAELQEKINTYFSKQKIGREPYSLYEPISYTLEAGGKRIRPVLVLMACNLFSEDVENALDAAVGIEIFHNFTLLHDDIMDKADIRRGKPTVHKKWGENTAILSGDAMLIKAYEYFFKYTSPDILQILNVFNNTALEVCEGQQYDMEFENRKNVAENEYIKMIELKTSVLLAGALKIGALIGGASVQNANFLYEFGKNIGLAFQLQDDLLDVYGDVNVFGKEIGGDIVANKKTMMLIKAIELANEKEKEKLEELLNSNVYSREEKISIVTNIYDKLNIKQIVQAKINELNQIALDYLNKTEVPDHKKSELKKLADKLLNRIS